MNLQPQVQRVDAGVPVRPGATWPVDLGQVRALVRCESTSPDRYVGVLLLGSDELHRTAERPSHDAAERAVRTAYSNAFRQLFDSLQ